ncbi:MAG: hypothetical protein AB7P61_07585 [Gemmatimonadales bacterium]
MGDDRRPTVRVRRGTAIVEVPACVECGVPIGPRSVRCPTHARERANALSRQRYAAMNPEAKAAYAARAKASRSRRVARIKLARRKGRLTGTWGYASREKYLDYQRRYNRRRLKAKREYERARYWRRKASMHQREVAA